MKKTFALTGVLVLAVLVAVTAFAAYHHEGEQDSDKFLAAYPQKADTKLDHCALCHSGGQYEKYEGKWVSLGSCQWCHYSYGYDGSGNIVDTLNAYGKAYYMAGRDAAAISAIDSQDSDGDGYSNAEEIAANRFPGDPEDDPSQKTAPYQVYTLSDLEAMTAHTQFMMMNTSRSGDFYAQYTGVPLQELLEDAGILDSATGITVFAPDGWSQYHPLQPDPDPELYHIFGTYPEATFQYDPEAEGWCDYSAPSVAGRSHNDPIYVPNGLKAILAYKREGAYLDPGVLTEENKLDGEGPYRVVVPQKIPSPPDQSSRSDNQDVIWPYTESWDHNAGACTRSATIIRVEPLPEGTTDIDLYEEGWQYVDEKKIIIYGAIADTASTPQLWFPHVACDGYWMTEVCLINRTEQAGTGLLQAYSAQGQPLSQAVDISLAANGRQELIVGQTFSDPAEIGYLVFKSATPGWTGYLKFHANQQRAAIPAMSGATEGVFAKSDSLGWTGVVLVNGADQTANLSLTGYTDAGEAVATQAMSLAPGQKRVDMLPNLFEAGINAASYVKFASDQPVAAFQLNGSADGTQLDGLPGL